MDYRKYRIREIYKYSCGLEVKIVVLFIGLIFFSGCTVTQRYEYLSAKYNNLSFNSKHNYHKEKILLEELILLENKNIKLDKSDFYIHSNQFIHYRDLGDIYFRSYEYDKALEQYSFAKKLVKKNDISELTFIVNRISYIYWRLNKKEKAISLLNDFLKTYEKELKNKVFKRRIDKTLKRYYLEKKQFKNITKIMKKETIDNNTSSRFCNKYNLLGDINLAQGKYTEAEKFYKYSLEVAKKQKIPNKKNERGILLLKFVVYDSDSSPYMDLVASYYKLGVLYLKKGDIMQSINYLSEALHAPNLLLSEKIKIKEALSEAYLSENSFDNYKKSIALLKEAISIKKEVSGEYSITALYERVSRLYYRLSDYKNSYKYIKKSYNIFSKNRLNNFSLLTNNEKINYILGKEVSISYLLYSAFLYNTKLSNDRQLKLSQTTLTDWLNYKGSISDAENMIRTLENQTTDKEVKNQIEQLKKEQQKLAIFIQNAKSKEQIEQQEQLIDKLFKSLAKNVNKFQEENELQSIDYKDISKYLKEDELYIDYARAGDDYYLFSLDHQNSISFIKLDRQFLSLIQGFRDEMKNIVENRLSNYKMNQNSKERLSKLYRLLLDPIKDELVSKKSLVISTDGALRLLPFETLFNQESQHYLIEDKNIRYIPSGKEFVRLHKYTQHETTESSKIVLFFNPNFEESNSSNPNTRSVPEFYKGLHLDSLEGTKEEAKVIKKLFGNSVEPFDKKWASEANLLRVKQPKILHIATHGFFNNDKKIKNPMLKSGLVLSGVIESKQEGNINGFVTALNLSALDLKGTELVVLSACDTGMVDIDATDSISGLGKAFIQAGAKDVVMSLWKVEDSATKELMVNFYQNIKDGLGYSSAMKEAKLKMIKDGIHPFYWGAFVVDGL
jgi:CHAT domain-containing protein